MARNSKNELIKNSVLSSMHYFRSCYEEREDYGGYICRMFKVSAFHARSMTINGKIKILGYDLNGIWGD